MPLAGFLAAVSFLTRLPVSQAPSLEADQGPALACFPLVGLVLGLALVAAEHALSPALSPFVVAALLATLLALLTGGLHLDGVADLCDAAGGGRGDRARMLEIMRDSRIGAHGATGLALVLIAKTAALADAIIRRDLRLLLLFPAIGRWAVTPVIVFFPYVRADGLGRGFKAAGRPLHVALATGLLAAVVLAAAPRLLLAVAGAIGAALVVALWALRRLGGATGDVYGAAVEAAELVALVAGCAR